MKLYLWTLQFIFILFYFILFFWTLQFKFQIIFMCLEMLIFVDLPFSLQPLKMQKPFLVATETICDPQSLKDLLNGPL